ncbi:MAG: ComEC/Rec2 family competence protein, partial [Pseudomonadota bacterium]
MGEIPGLPNFIARQRGRLFLWVPICLAIGISIYFNLPLEPGRPLLGLLTVCAICIVLVARRSGETAAPLLIGLALVIAGTALAGWRAHHLTAPVLEFRYYGPVEGRIVAIDRSISDRLRITLDRVVLRETAPDRTPTRVRVALHGDIPGTELRAGLLVGVTAHLSPPAGPVEPGGFDFQRLAWFKKLGAVGYSRTPVVALAPPEARNLSAHLFRIRLALSDAIRARLPGQTGAFAAAILTGDRSGLSRETLDTMRATNLAHLLAISGLHLGLLTGFVFAIMRGAIALIPPLALRVPAKKWAALVALPAAAAYLALSGGNVATQRAFVMAAVMLCAVLLDKRAFTLRAVALAAVIILVLRPETLTGPGFQMSFA